MTINVFAGAVVFAILVIIWIGMMSVASLVEYLMSYPSSHSVNLNLTLLVNKSPNQHNPC